MSTGIVTNPTRQAIVYKLLIFSAPFVISRLVDIFKVFVGNAYLSTLGSNYTAAGGLISTSQLALVNTALCVPYGIGIMVSRTRHDDYERLSELSTTAFFFALLLSAPLILFSLFSKELLILIGQNEALSSITRDYYFGFSWGIPATLLLAFLQQFVLGRKDAYLVLYSVIFNTLLMTGLGYILTCGTKNIPSLGASGLGHANSIAAWITFLVFFIYVSISKRHRETHIFHLVFTNSKATLCELSKTGGTIAIRIGCELIALFIVTAMIAAWIGQDALEAEQVANQYTLLMVLPLFGMAQATAIMAGEYIRTKNFKMVQMVTEAGSLISFIMSFIMITIVAACPKQLASLFMNVKNNPGIYTTARNLLYINAASQLPDAQRNILGGVLNAMGDQRSPLVTSIVVNTGMAVGFGYLMAFTANMSTEGIFYARLITMFVGAIILQLIFKHRMVRSTIHENNFQHAT